MNNNEEVPCDINYYGMKNWVHDLPINSNCKQIFIKMLQLLKNKENVKILEIGTFVGGSILNMLKILPKAKATVIDLWNLSPVEQNVIKQNSDNQNATIENSYNIFLENIKREKKENFIEIIRGDSTEELVKLLRTNKKFDFIYIDGSHMCLDVHADAILSWELLNKDGILAFDDVYWSYDGHSDLTKDNPLNIPLYAVDHFLRKYHKEYKLLEKGYRFFIQKI